MRCDKSTCRPIPLFNPGHQTVRQQIRGIRSLGLSPPGSPYQTKFRRTVSPRTSKRKSNITQLSKLFTATHEARERFIVFAHSTAAWQASHTFQAGTAHVTPHSPLHRRLRRLGFDACYVPPFRKTFFAPPYLLDSGASAEFAHSAGCAAAVYCFLLPRRASPWSRLRYLFIDLYRKHTDFLFLFMFIIF